MKYFSYILLILLFFLLSIPTQLFGKDASDPLPLASHFSKKYQDDLKGLLAKRYIRILTTFNKTNFFLSGGRFFGFEYSLLKEYEKFLNKGIKRRELKVVLEFMPVSRDRLISGLVEGYGDIAAAGLTITPKRLAIADFSDPYVTGVDEVIVSNKGISRPKSIDDLSGREVFIRESSSYYESLISLNNSFSKSKRRPVKIIKADENLETEDILELVNSGAIEMTVSDSHLAEAWSGILGNLKIHKNVMVRSGGKIAWMVRKNNPALKDNLNKFMKKHRKGTLLGNIYFDRYYKKNRWIKNPLRRKPRKNLEHYKLLFKKYASKYNFDWMLIMAMAFQESELDHKKRNPSGALGIMQVLPSTGKDKNIKIGDVKKLENNIHVGVKYLKFLRNRYFNDDRISPRNQVRLAMAAYNAGPAKIRRARKLAKKMGLDPNRWFRNVEMAVLKIVGQETVRYVSNINKYYIIYKLNYQHRGKREKEKSEIKDEA